ncbi:MAG: hypothetical protein ACTSWV_04795 [Candidatus Asgardarchaeia archaeon]
MGVPAELYILIQMIVSSLKTFNFTILNAVYGGRGSAIPTDPLSMGYSNCFNLS